MTWWERLDEEMKARGWSMAELHRRSGIPYDSINKYLRGEVDQPRGDTIERLARAIERDPIWLREGLDRSPSNAKIGDRIGSPELWRIPLYGSAVGGVDGEFVLNGNKLDDILAPPSLNGTMGAYAVTVAGESMEPRYEDGETLYVDPHHRVGRGDYCVVQVQFEEHEPPLAYIKRFVRRNAEEIVLEQFNPPKELRFPNKNVVSVHYVVMAGRI
jgi:phage repressor protein C with HTH and peptisase S24 domain